MENYEAFTEYLDGRLPYAEEQKLFSEMNMDEGLREQFRRFVTLDRTMKKTAIMNVPPQQLTNKIYAGLGFTIPGNTKIIKTPVTATGIGFLNSGIFKMLITGLSSAVVGVIATLFFFKSLTVFDNSGIEKKPKMEQVVKENPVILKNTIQPFTYKTEIS